MKIIKNTDEDAVKKTIEVLKNGGLVVAPSDTVYGLLVNATNEEAVKKLIQFKDRPTGKSISVFVSGMEMLCENVDVNAHQNNILTSILPGSYTIVLPSRHKVQSLLESEKGTLGVRYIKYEFINNLLKEFRKPTTATSANLSGKSSNHSVESLLHQLSDSKKELIDLIVDAGQLPKNKPSTVMDLTESSVKILRQGDSDWKNNETFISKSADETMQIAKSIFEKTVVADKPVVYILKGDLGAGKTVFVKGIAEKFNVTNIISPTFTIYYEYKIENNPEFKLLYHFDLYNIEDPEEYKHLGIESYLKPGNLLFFEWGEKAGDIYELLKEKAKVIFIEINYVNENTREIKLGGM